MSVRPLLILLVFTLALSPTAADYKDGLAAYEAGDFERAQQEWTPLAERGVAEAQYNLGLLYHRGKGVPADAAIAFDWYRQAAEGDYDRAQYRVAEMYESGEGTRKDLVQAHLWFRVAGEKRYLDARKRRKRVADRMTPEQIAMAEMLARHRRRDAQRGEED